MEQLTNEQMSRVCMFMRVIDLLKSRPDILEQCPEMKTKLDQVCRAVNQIMELLTEEQRDAVLEEHQRQLEILKENH
jgi:hypothetical protein